MSTTRKTALGVSIPIKLGKEGYFEQTYTSLDQIKTNIKNLLYTRQGERRMNPEFGSRLWTIVFEQNVDSLQGIVQNTLKEDISRWVSGIEVENIDVVILKSDESMGNKDIYKLNITVSFMVSFTKQKDTVTLTVSNN